MLFGKKPDKTKPKSPPDSGKKTGVGEFEDSIMDGDTVAMHAEVSQETVRARVPGRPKVLSITIKDRKTLHAAYKPFVMNGGIFVPSANNYDIGDEIFLLLKLLDSKEKISISGAVIWITPEGAMSNRVAGIGVQFTGPDAGTVRSKIEGILGGALQSRRMTHTM